MTKANIWLQGMVLFGMLATLPALAEKGKEKEEKTTYRSSIQAPVGKETSEKSEQAQLRKLARITEKQAIQTATSKAGGAKFLGAELENENGNVVYVVKFKAAVGEREIVVDAGTGKILADQVEKD